jgi:hypothetical protein
MLSVDEFVRVPPGEVDDPEEKAEDDRYFNEYVTHSLDVKKYFFVKKRASIYERQTSHFST